MIFTESLKNNRDFQVVYGEGKSFANKYLVMFNYNIKRVVCQYLFCKFCGKMWDFCGILA